MKCNAHVEKENNGGMGCVVYNLRPCDNFHGALFLQLLQFVLVRVFSESRGQQGFLF